jgi:hypothetical protein
MNNLERIRAVTANFYLLQGLRLVPIGLWLMAAGSGLLGAPGNCTLALPALLVTMALYWAAGRYYERNFGRVERAAADRRAENIAGVVMLAALLVAQAIESVWRLPFSLLALVIAAFLFYVHWRTPGGFRKHYLGLAVLLAALSVVPLFLNRDAQGLWPALQVVTGAALAAGGLLDHLVLSRALHLTAEQRHG